MEIFEQMTSVFKQYYEDMLQITNNLSQIKERENSKMLSVVNESSTSSSLPPTNVQNLDLSSLSAELSHNTNKFDWLNSSLSMIQDYDYKYSQMDSVFDHDFSFSFNLQDFENKNYVSFLTNRTNLKTFTNNRVLVGSMKKDSISIVNFAFVFISICILFYYLYLFV